MTEPYAIGSERHAGLAKIIEECGELIEVCAKIIGNGGSFEYYDGTELDARLAQELADVLAAIQYTRAHNIGLVAFSDYINKRKEDKFRLFQAWDQAERSDSPGLRDYAYNLLLAIKHEEAPPKDPVTPQFDYPLCRYEGCERPAEETMSVAADLLGYLSGSGDAKSVPLCHDHGMYLRTKAVSGCSETCRYPFGSHAPTCADYVARG